VDLKAFISGCCGTSLTDGERRFFAENCPCGLILFARNCDTPEQLRALVASFRDAVESDEVLILIDQEGGRVQRLRPPYWRNMPPARCYGRVYERDAEAGKAATFAGARLIAQELFDLGINVNCTPVLDVPERGAHEIIGDRAFSTDPDVVGVLGRAVMEGTLAGGVLPVIKHMPGHGRAKADSHLSLPRIDVSVANPPVSGTSRCTARHDRARSLAVLRRAATGDHLARYNKRSDSWADRVRRLGDER
jgi:beta-N-acetylhexosaminidase